MNRCAARGRGGRGMVTAELAVAILAAFSVFVLLCWGILLLVLQLRCVDTATAVARQEARSDRAGSSLARSEAPEGASTRGGRGPSGVHMAVRRTVRPLASGGGSVPLHAGVSVVPEPAA